MTSIESHTRSFIIKIWLEEEPADGNSGQWRGHITHVDSGERRYLLNLEDILSHIAPYLTMWGVKIKLRLRLMLWLNELGRRKETPDKVESA